MAATLLDILDGYRRAHVSAMIIAENSRDGGDFGACAFNQSVAAETRRRIVHVKRQIGRMDEYRASYGRQQRESAQ